MFVILLEVLLTLLTEHVPTPLQFEKALVNTLVDEVIGSLGDACCVLILGEENCESFSVCEVFFDAQLCSEGGLCFNVLGQNSCMRF